MHFIGVKSPHLPYLLTTIYVHQYVTYAFFAACVKIEVRFTLSLMDEDGLSRVLRSLTTVPLQTRRMRAYLYSHRKRI